MSYKKLGYRDFGIYPRESYMRRDTCRSRRCRLLGCKMKDSIEYPDGWIKFLCVECGNVQKCHKDDKDFSGFVLRRSIIQPWMEFLWHQAYPEQERLLTHGFVKDENYEDFSFTG